MLIGSLANGSASDGVAVFPNLGYKKDAFLELSLVSNNFPLPPNKPTTIPTLNTTALFLIVPCPPTACNSMQQQQPQSATATPCLDPWSPCFTPRGPVGPLPVDALGRSAQAIQEGGEMRGNMFVTTRGDQISRPHGRRPQNGRIGGPYPRIDEVSEGI